MALSEVLGSGLSGLAAAQAALRGVADNIANARAAGYARVRVDMQPQVAGGRLAGVRAEEATRIADRFLDAATVATRGDAGAADVSADWLGRAVALFGQPGGKTGLEATLAGVQAAAIALPGGGAEAAATLVTRADEALLTTRRVLGGLDELRAQARDEIGRTLPRINDLLRQAAGLNDEVARNLAMGRSVSGVADRRAATVAELGELIGVRSLEDASGRLVLETAGGQVLLDRSPRLLEQTTDGLTLRLLDSGGQPTQVSEPLDPVGAGGRVSALLRLADVELPRLADSAARAAEGLATALNTASAEATRLPPPAVLRGAPIGLLGSDRLAFTGTMTVGVTDAAGTLLARAEVGGAEVASIDGFVSLLNTRLAGQAEAVFNEGRLELRALAPGAGIAAAGGRDRDDRSVAQVLGFNAVVETPAFATLPLGAGAEHGAAPGQTLALRVRDPAGRSRLVALVEPATAGSTVGDVVAALNGSAAGQGAFALQDGRLVFRSTAGEPWPIERVADSTVRGDTGVSLGDALGVGVGCHAARMLDAGIAPWLLTDPAMLPTARFDPSAAVGSAAVARGGATERYAAALAAPLPGAAFGRQPLDRLIGSAIADAGTASAAAAARQMDADARAQEATARRESFSGVDVDAELALMVQLQTAYGASARVVSAAREMMDDILRMVG